MLIGGDIPLMIEVEENMKQTIQKKDKNVQAMKKVQWNWWLLPLQFVLGILPLVMALYQGSSGYAAYTWNGVQDAYLDVFLHGKMVAFIIVSAITLALVVYRTIQLKNAERKALLRTFIPMIIYTVMVLLSTFLSENLEGSLTGAMDQKEPVWVLLGYVVVLVYAYLVIERKEDWNQLTYAAIFGSCLMALLGVMQAIGKDPMTWEWVQRLFVGREYIQKYGLLKLVFPVGQAYVTMFNPNYVGTFVALYIPLLAVGLFTNKKLWVKLCCGLSAVGLLITLFASQSRTGLIAIVAVFVMFLVFMGRGLWKRWYLVIPSVTFVVLTFSLIDTYRDNLLTNRLKQMFAIEKSQDALKGIDTTGNGVRVLYKNTEFTVQMPVSRSDFAYVVMENGKSLEVTYDEHRSHAYFTLSTGDELTIETAAFDNQYAFGLLLDGRNYYFTNQIVKGNYKFINEFGRADECTILRNVFQGYEAAASGRGYVWGRTIPLMLDNFIIGSGPDTFAVEFPQTDYVARYKSGFETVIFTRPHNFYLQMGVQTGVISLLAFLVFYGIYFVGCCRRYFFCKFKRMEEWGGFAVFLCTIGFMASGFANDSLIVVSPMFYLLLGAGMAINHKLCPVEKKVRAKQEEKVENEEGQE